MRQVHFDYSATGFEFDDYSAADDEIETMFSDDVRPVPDLDCLFAFDLEAALLQFVDECTAINIFDETRTKFGMDGSRSLNDAVSQFFGRSHARYCAN